jgi:hypothetical protein
MQKGKSSAAPRVLHRCQLKSTLANDGADRSVPRRIELRFASPGEQIVRRPKPAFPGSTQSGMPLDFRAQSR